MSYNSTTCGSTDTLDEPGVLVLTLTLGTPLP